MLFKIIINYTTVIQIKEYHRIFESRGYFTLIKTNSFIKTANTIKKYFDAINTKNIIDFFETNIDYKLHVSKTNEDTQKSGIEPIIYTKNKNRVCMYITL